jgi:hypothetical protein
MDNTSNKRWWRLGVGGVVVVGGFIAGASDEETSDIKPGIVDMVDTLEAQRDCASLQDAFDRMDDADTLEYIDDALRDAGCYG